jgi:hypothetical protein
MGIFYGGAIVSLTPQPPTWRTKVSLLVRVVTLELSAMGVLNSSNATAGVALRVI